MSDHRLPLSRFTVLDLTAHRAGPACVRQLADWGANVIKIEAPSAINKDKGGLTGARHGFDFQNLHRNKRSLTLDLKSEGGKEIFFKLVEQADVVVENFRSAVKHRLGIDYEPCAKVNPRIVYGSIAGFGQDGPYGKRPGVDQIAQGMGGLMSITGLPGQGPVRVGIPICDLTSGIFLAQGILMALLDREVTGKGQWVHTSLLESIMQMLDFQASRWTIASEVAPQAGNNHPTGIPTGVFPTSDGHINIAASGNNLWLRFCKTIGHEELTEDPDYATGDARSANRDALNALLGEITKQKSSQEWIDLLNEAGVPCGPIYSIDQVFADPQVQHLQMTRPASHPVLGELNLLSQALNLTGTPEPDKIRRPTPELGEHTDEILAEIGYDKDAVETFHTSGAV
ncbi:MAG: CoA transferase [Alphaproteobacteria bacterium]|nr:CoA transferase [Alphaproteobacteria bacterium]